MLGKNMGIVEKVQKRQLKKLIDSIFCALQLCRILQNSKLIINSPFTINFGFGNDLEDFAAVVEKAFSRIGGGILPKNG